MIRGIIFDLGGTLMTFKGDWDEFEQRATKNLTDFLGAQGIATLDNFYARFFKQRKRHWIRAEETGVECRLEDALRDTLADLGHSMRDDLFPRALEKYFGASEPQWRPYPDAIAMLDTLRARGLRLGLISNADDEPVVYRLVERVGLAPYLDPVLSSAAEPRWRKPDPRIFHLVSNAWELPPREIAMVGDAPRYDILGAHRAGMRAILIDYGDNAPWQQIPDELAKDPAIKPDATVRALAEIPGVIEKW